jgi:non-ribosomal peptide synthetase component F
MSQWTGKDDIIVGTPVANRNKQAVRETMGYCSGVVPLRGHVDRARSFTESLRLVHETTVESFANAMPFAELVRALGETAATGRNPVFELRFALQNHPVPDVAVPGLALQLRMRSTGTPRFDLACEINEEGDALEVAWLFWESQFAIEDIQNVSRLYLAVLAGVCRSPETLTAALMSTLR